MGDKNQRKDVILMTTGGTIDKSYDEFDGSLTNRETLIKDGILSRLRLPYTFLHVFSVMSKDSLFMTDYDRTFLAKSIKAQMGKGFPIIVLHGTDTMAKSAEAVKSVIGDITVPIIFTGAMRPLGFDYSDATQNVTEALLASTLLEPNVYISFHGRIFNVPGCRKNKEKRTFEEV